MRPLGADARPAQPGAGTTMPDALSLLQWVYVGRVLVATVVFLAAAFYYTAIPPEVIIVLAVAALASLGASGASAFWTHIRRHRAGATFVYVQASFDLALVTVVMHVTGGAESAFLPLYILVIAVASVLLPLPSSLLLTALASSIFVADIVVGFPEQLSIAVWLQIGVFVSVAVATGWLASRVRLVGQERAVLVEEVKRLRLEAGDILRNIGSGVVTVDGDGNLLYANPSAERLLAFDAAAYVDRPVLELLASRSPELAATLEATRQSGDHGTRAEGRVTLADHAFDIGLTTTALEASDRSPPSVTAIFTDISDQKRIQSLHLRAERLEAVAELSASLAHEIKNPLASIRSSVEQLANASAAGDDERFLGQLVIRESDRLSRLLNEFLDFARVRVVVAKPVDLTQVLRSAVDVVRQHPACRPQTEMRVVADCPPLVGDEDLLHRVVANLVLNAVQAANGDVTVTVEARRARQSELPRGALMTAAVLLRVSDNGPGIPTDLRERLFDPFVSGRIGGSGLGLAIVQRAVEAHQGYVFVESTSGKGSTFTILLPLGGSDEAAA